MFSRLAKFLDENAWTDARISLPSARFVAFADAVVTGTNTSPRLAEHLLEHADVETAEFIAAARCVNIRFKDMAMRGYLEGVQVPLPLFTMPCEATQWEEAILSIRYAHYRARKLVEQEDVPPGNAALARKLAVSARYCVYRLSQSDTEEAFLQSLAALAADYHIWHESLLRRRVAATLPANGELMQKEAIQGPLSGALLARSAAAILHDGLLALSLELDENNAEA